MAKQIESLLVRLGIEGYEELARLKGAFRGLETTLGQSDAALNKARQAILDYGKGAQRSESLLKGMEAALKGVREQATLHSPLYTQLTQDIKELSAAQREYIADLNSTKSAYAQLAIAEEGAARRAAKLRNIQQLAVGENPLVVAGRRPTEFGGVPQVAPGPGGVFIAPPGRSTPYKPGTQYDRPIGPQPVSQQVRSAERAVEQAMQGINDAMERSLNERAKLQEKYQQRQYDQLLEGLDLEGKARKQAFDRELADFDARLAATEKRRKRGFSGMQAAQVAGAAISGGIFGGPEGFLGGVAGGALGGVGGAFAGAAIGAQVAGLRQAAGAAAEYAAAINQQRRALEGVVESNAAYQQSLAFIDQTSRQLAIPQEQVTRNFTRLSASVLGAGGNVDAAQEAFMGIAAGIRGTGGSLADLDAALLATAQVFSKGKVSAEELRGQIGERLPGAFTLFAESIGKTPQQLDKMLEKGEVGLNDFMAFVRRLSSEYGASANELANSSEAAGDRLQTAFGRIQEAIGEAFQPVGAEFQEALSRFVLENEQALVSLAQALADAGKGFLDFAVAAGPVLVELGKFALAFGAATLATKAFTAAMPALRAAMVLLQAQFGQMTAQAAAAQTRLVAFGATVKALAASLAVPIVLTIAIVGVTKVLEDLNRVRRARQELAELPDPVAEVGRAYGNRVTAADRQRLIADLEETGNQISEQSKKVKELRDRYEEAKRSSAVTGFAARTFNVIGRAGRQAAEDEYRTAVARLESLQEKQRLLGSRMSQIGTGSPTESSFQFPSPAAEAAGAKEKKGPKPPEDRTRELQAEYELYQRVANQENAIRDALFKGEEIRAAQLETGKEQLQIMYERNRELRAANYESEKEVIRAFALEKIEDSRRKLADKIREIKNAQFQTELQNQQAVRDAAEPIKQAREQQELQLQNAKEYLRLVQEGMTPSEANRIINWQNLISEQLKSLDVQIDIAEANVAAAEAAGAQTKQLKDQLDLLRRKRRAVAEEAGKGPARGPTEVEKVQGEIARLQGELNELTSISTQLVTHATAIGDAFAKAFVDLVSGAASGKEALAQFFEAVSQSFLKMATEIIAKQVTMLILQTALKALGAVSGGPAAPGANIQSGADFGIPGQISTGMSLAAKGAAYGPQGPMDTFARGGLVMSPTMFAYAKGGTPGNDRLPFQRGLMGEAGPEAVMPLERGPDGRLGVIARLGRGQGTQAALPFPQQGQGGQGTQAAVPFQQQGQGGQGTQAAVPFQQQGQGGQGTQAALPFQQQGQGGQGTLMSIPFSKTTERRLVERSDRETIAAIQNPKPLEVKFESQIIANTEYVTAEQHRRGMAQAAERGRALALDSLQNSVKARRKVGVT